MDGVGSPQNMGQGPGGMGGMMSPQAMQGMGTPQNMGQAPVETRANWKGQPGGRDDFHMGQAQVQGTGCGGYGPGGGPPGHYSPNPGQMSHYMGGCSPAVGSTARVDQ